MTPLPLFHLHEAISGVQEQTVKAIGLMCLNCGALYLHAAGVLDNKMNAAEEAAGGESANG